LVKSANLRRLIQKNRRGGFKKHSRKPHSSTSYHLHHLVVMRKLEEGEDEV